MYDVNEFSRNYRIGDRITITTVFGYRYTGVIINTTLTCVQICQDGALNEYICSYDEIRRIDLLETVQRNVRAEIREMIAL